MATKVSKLTLNETKCQKGKYNKITRAFKRFRYMQISNGNYGPFDLDMFARSLPPKQKLIFDELNLTDLLQELYRAKQYIQPYDEQWIQDQVLGENRHQFYKDWLGLDGEIELGKLRSGYAARGTYDSTARIGAEINFFINALINKYESLAKEPYDKLLKLPFFFSKKPAELSNNNKKFTKLNEEQIEEDFGYTTNKFPDNTVKICEDKKAHIIAAIHKRNGKLSGVSIKKTESKRSKLLIKIAVAMREKHNLFSNQEIAKTLGDSDDCDISDKAKLYSSWLTSFFSCLIDKIRFSYSKTKGISLPLLDQKIEINAKSFLKKQLTDGSTADDID